jgi:hypothetical protein
MSPQVALPPLRWFADIPARGAKRPDRARNRHLVLRRSSSKADALAADPHGGSGCKAGGVQATPFVEFRYKPTGGWVACVEL